MELLTKTKSDHRDLIRCHVWGFPVFVLKPNGQNYQKLPKWNQQARMGQFLGFSDEHYSLVENVIILSTGYISPQFHLVFDDLFEMVICTKDDKKVLNNIFNDVFDLNRDWYSEDEHDDNRKLIYQPPPSEDIWIDEQGFRNCWNELENQHRRQEGCIREKNRAVLGIIPLNTKDNCWENYIKGKSINGLTMHAECAHYGLFQKKRFISYVRILHVNSLVSIDTYV